ncbi:MAG: alpha/beta hydrolase-fold protein [Chryseolinea sp.]
MKMKLIKSYKVPLLLIVTMYLCVCSSSAQSNTKSGRGDIGLVPKGTVVTETITSEILKENQVGLDLVRTIKIYLPPGYSASGKSYPVIYYCHSIFQNPDKVLADGKLISLLEKGFGSGIAKEMILVIADYSSQTTGSLYENSTTTGRWIDYTTDEVIPFIDSHFRTLRQTESRALVGEMMGGRGVFQLAISHPEKFSVAYAMNPVGTAAGFLPMSTYPNWQKIHNAKSFADLKDEHISQIFVTMSQAFLPNPNRPPFFCDFLMEMQEGKPVLQAKNATILRNGFLIDHILDRYPTNLLTLRGLAFDWSRYDPIQDHVYGSKALSYKLESLGINHEAEEYRGVYWEENWNENGRFYSRVLPFIERNLVFEKTKN